MAGHGPSDGGGGCAWCRDRGWTRAPRILPLALRVVRLRFLREVPAVSVRDHRRRPRSARCSPLRFRLGSEPPGVEGLGGLSIDGIVICAIGTLSLGALSDNVGPLVILAVVSVAWSIVLALVIGRRVFEQDWFEHSIAEFGEGQGNVATGFMMVDMVDPTRQTGVVRGYSYRQLFTRPLIGGGFISALSVPLIAALGLPVFTIVAVVMTVGLTILGIRRAAPGRSAFQSSP
jgi:hypothetical protein